MNIRTHPVQATSAHAAYRETVWFGRRSAHSKIWGPDTQADLTLPVNGTEHDVTDLLANRG